MKKFKNLEEYVNICYNWSFRQGFNLVYFIADYISKSYICIPCDIIMPSHIVVNSEEWTNRIINPIINSHSSYLFLNPYIVFFKRDVVMYKEVDLFIKGEGTLRFTMPKIIY